MKKIISIIALSIIALLAGCASNDKVTSSEAIAKLNAMYCNSKGFKTFQELPRYWSFRCKIGGSYMIKKD